MAYWVRIDNEDDFFFLKNMLGRGAVKARTKPATFGDLDDAQRIVRLNEAMDQAKQTAPEEPLTQAPAEKPRKPRQRVQREPAYQPKLCNDHPTYGAQRTPRTDCATCWKLYEKYQGKPAADAAKAKRARKINR